MLPKEDNVGGIQKKSWEQGTSWRSERTEIKLGQSSSRKLKCLCRNHAWTQCSRRSWPSLQEIANLSTAHALSFEHKQENFLEDGIALKSTHTLPKIISSLQKQLNQYPKNSFATNLCDYRVCLQVTRLTDVYSGHRTSVGLTQWYNTEEDRF